LSKILVTGSAGFIGFHVSKKLLESGNKVIGIDNYSDYYDVRLKKDKAQILKKSPNFKEYIIDISEKKELDKVFLDEKFDLVINLAAQPGVRYALTNPFIYEKTNNLGFLNILECCKEFGVKKIVYASSSSVYGGNKTFPFSEGQRTDNPISLYAATKKYNELLASCYSQLYGLNCIGLRLFTVYGPWNRPDMAIFIFCKKILSGEEIELFNNGKMERDFTFIDDIVDGIILATKSNEKNTVFNLGRGETVQLKELVRVIEKEAGLKAKIRLSPIQKGDLEKTHSDITKAKKILGYKPKTRIPQGIKKFVEWYKEYYKEKK